MRKNEKTADALKSVEKRLADMAVLMKHVTTYQKTKTVYEAYRRAKDKDTYRAKQESSLILHEAAAKALKAAGVTKLPNLAAMQEEYGKLQAQKEALYTDYGKLEKTGQGIRRYQTEHRQYFKTGKRTGTGQGNRTLTVEISIKAW